MNVDLSSNVPNYIDIVFALSNRIDKMTDLEIQRSAVRKDLVHVSIRCLVGTERLVFGVDHSITSFPRPPSDVRPDVDTTCFVELIMML